MYSIVLDIYINILKQLHMKLVFQIVLMMLCLLYSFPLIALAGMVAIWKWDYKYIDRFTDKLWETVMLIMF